MEVHGNPEVYRQPSSSLVCTNGSRAKKKKKKLARTTPREQSPRKWNGESMKAAIKAVAEGKLGVNRAADQYAVYTTVYAER